jgi:hypothetical protein
LQPIGTAGARLHSFAGDRCGRVPALGTVFLVARACWQGRVAEVVEELEKQQAALGRPPPGEELAANDPRRVVAEALSYLGNNAERMNDPEYRRQGLPTTSSLVESRVGEFNARVKGKEKFWNRPGGAEAILQVRAALLSEDGRLPRHFASRLGSLLESIRNLRQLFSWVSVQ